MHATVLLPLPTPDAKNAPHFDGKHLDQFLQTLEILVKNAGLTDTALPSLVKAYSSKCINKALAGDEAIFSGTDWAAAKAKLRFFFDDAHRECKPTAQALRDFVDKTRAEGYVKNLASLQTYMVHFAMYQGRMVEEKELSDTECNLLFFRGFPEHIWPILCQALEPILKASGRTFTKQSLPTIEETVLAAKSYFNPDNIDFIASTPRSKKSWFEESDSESASDDKSSSVASDSSDDGWHFKKRSRSKKGKGKACHSKLRH
ncbi:hypothetical protein NM688_g7366 [Phlebia brevispora]|uniref:Uncharacterized protein n=1 Tax=Phlebia brevispora TaxID=194682 RepID=A0ACC1S640_9APHY|nr:hypothetical protein NM688_g7366 [Phlebia brevispora]